MDEDKKNKKDEDGCLLLVSFIFSLIVSPLLNSFVLTKLWAWFIAATFHVQTLTYGQAYGVAFVVSYLTFHGNLAENRSTKEQAKNLLGYALVRPLVRPLLALLFAWFYKTYVFSL